MGRPKAGVILQGLPLYQRGWQALSQVCQQVVILGHGHGIPENLPRLDDLRPQVGPLGGLEALLHSGLGSHYLLLPCDMPAITPDLLQDLILPTFPLTSYDRPGGPLPLFANAELAPTLSQWLDGGGRSVWAFLESYRAHHIPCPKSLYPALQDIDNPQDLSQWEHR